MIYIHICMYILGLARFDDGNTFACFHVKSSRKEGVSTRAPFLSPLSSPLFECTMKTPFSAVNVHFIMLYVFHTTYVTPDYLIFHPFRRLLNWRKTFPVLTTWYPVIPSHPKRQANRKNLWNRKYHHYAFFLHINRTKNLTHVWWDK